MKPHFAALALAVLPVAASAQVPVPVMPAMRMPIISSPGGERVAGISVSGRATVQAPVHDVTLAAYARGVYDTSAALAAMRAAGVDDAGVGPANGMLNVNSPTLLRGTIRNATESKLEALQRAALQFAAAHPGVTIDNVRFAGRLADCEPFESQARSAAFGDARRRAQAIATLAGGTLGPILAVNENGTCQLPTNPNGPEMPLDLSTMTTPISVFENITFALIPNNAPKRRPL